MSDWLDKLSSLQTIVKNGEILSVNLVIPVTEGQIVFYDPTTGEECDVLRRGTHWRYIHQYLDSICVKSVRHIIDLEIYVVEYNISLSDENLHKLYQYYERKYNEDSVNYRTNTHYTYN